MKRYRPYKAGFIVLYVLAGLSLLDVAFTVYRRVTNTMNPIMDSFSAFSYVVLAMAAAYVWMYARAQVCFDGDNIRVAFPASLRPKEGENRVFFIFRQGELDTKLIDKTFSLKSVVRYGYVEDLGYERLDKSSADEKNKLFPVREVAFITSDNKRYHMNAGSYSAKQQKEIFAHIREVSGVAPEGKLAEVLG